MRVSEVMQPRITMEALEVNATLADFLQLVDTTKYSRVIMCGHVHWRVLNCTCVCVSMFVLPCSQIFSGNVWFRVFIFSLFFSISLRLLYSEKVPVYEGEIDRVVGVAIAKDALRFAMQPQLHDTMKVSELMEPTYFVPESMRVQVVLEEMRRRRLHMAIVVSHELWGLK